MSAYSSLAPKRQYFFLSDFYHWGGTVTFTAHLLNKIGRKQIVRIGNVPKGDKITGNFGYGLDYQIVSLDFIDKVDKPFVVDFFKYYHVLRKLKRDDITIVIHDPTEISEETAPYLEYWNVICIRKAFQEYLKNNYNVHSKFLYHPFYPYSTKNNNDGGSLAEYSNGHIKEHDREKEIEKTTTVSISRVDYGKNTEIIMDANKLLKKEEKDCGHHDDYTIKIHGPFNPQYVNDKLGGGQNFRQYYRGTFAKSFRAVSAILNKAKFVVDLSRIYNDGGGTQYTFLEAIYHGAALIINRKWIEDLAPKYCDFKEGYNCYAISNAQELAEIIKNSKNLDTDRIVNNSKKLMDRHVNASWSSV
jgi:glycosyltransferase involved in cell wall biosynthesis